MKIFGKSWFSRGMRVCMGLTMLALGDPQSCDPEVVVIGRTSDPPSCMPGQCPPSP